MAKKILLTLLFLFISIIALFFLWRYIGYLRDKDPYKTFLLPRVELSVFEITSLSSEKADMTAKMLVQNQFPITFKADSLQYMIFINDVEVMKSQYKKSITLSGNDSSWISLPVTIFNNDLVTVLKKYEHKNIDTVEYRLKATFYSNILFGKKINIDIKRLLPLVYIPEVNVEKLKIDSLNFSRAAFQLLVSINNKNVFPLRTKNAAYEFSIEGNEWVTGTIPGLIDIKEKSVTELKIPLRISLSGVSKTLLDLLKKGSEVKYKLNLVFKIDSESDMTRNSKVILKSSGTVKSLINVAKL